MRLLVVLSVFAFWHTISVMMQMNFCGEVWSEMLQLHADEMVVSVSTRRKKVLANTILKFWKTDACSGRRRAELLY